MLNESIPTSSASTASSMVLRMTTSPASGRPDASTVTKTGVSSPNSISGPLITNSTRGLEQLEVELDLHHVAERDRADPRRHCDVDAEVLAADLSRGFEAGVAGTAREVLDASEFDGKDDGTRDVADGQVTVDLVL